MEMTTIDLQERNKDADDNDDKKKPKEKLSMVGVFEVVRM